MTLLDRLPLVAPRTLDGLTQVGWTPRVVAMDVFDWLASRDATRWDVIFANLFLHHFSERCAAEPAAGNCGTQLRLPLLRAQARRRGAGGKPPRRLAGGRTRDAAGRGVERARGIPRPGTLGPLARPAGLEPRRAACGLVQSLLSCPPERAVSDHSLRRDHCRRRPLRRDVRGAPRAGRMAGCGRREGAVPTAQSLWRIHFRDHLAAVGAIGRCRTVAELAGPRVRRVAVYAGTTMVDSGFGIVRRAGRRAVVGPSVASISTRCCSSAPLQPGRRCGSPARWRSSLSARDGYECTIVDKGTRQSRVLRSRLIVAAHGSWESGALPTQDLRRPPMASDLLAFKAHFIRQRAAPGPDASARLSGGLWRAGAHRRWSRQPVVLHSPRPTRSLPATMARRPRR